MNSGVGMKEKRTVALHTNPSDSQGSQSLLKKQFSLPHKVSLVCTITLPPRSVGRRDQMVRPGFSLQKNILDAVYTPRGPSSITLSHTWLRSSAGRVPYSLPFLQLSVILPTGSARCSQPSSSALCTLQPPFFLASWAILSKCQ